MPSAPNTFASKAAGLKPAAPCSNFGQHALFSPAQDIHPPYHGANPLHAVCTKRSIMGNALLQARTVTLVACKTENR